MNSSANKPGCFRKLSPTFAVAKIRARSCLFAATVVMLLAVWGARADQSIYSDSLHADWFNWMGDGVADLNNSTPVHSGSKSIALLDPWSYFLLGRYPPMALAGFASLDFSLHSGANGQSNMFLALIFVGSVEPADATSFLLPVLTPDVWHNVSIPLNSPALANRTDFQGIFIGSYDSDRQPYFVDDIRLTSVPEPSLLGLFGMGWLIAARRFKGAKH